MKYFEYQSKAIQELFKKIKKDIGYYMVDINDDGTYNIRTIHFISPTGSGKTIMAFGTMDELSKAYNNLVFVWIAPNTLHSQSLDKFNMLSDITTSELTPIDSDGIESDNILKSNEILCLNWSSLDKKTNLLIAENETGKYLDNIIAKTKEDGKIIIALIDESHIASQNEKTKAFKFLQGLNPAIKIEITATPKNISVEDEKVEVAEEDVKAEGVIKKQFIFNDFNDNNIDDAKLVKYAYEKLQAITKKYSECSDAKIVPLMIIQIENEKNDGYRKEQIKIERYLENIGVDVKNEVAYYLDKDKSKSSDLARNDNPIQIVFTKTAIATGWDCPRASVLLTFRKSNDDKFKTQVLGRINRMPELKHYGEILLDTAYVYANASKYIPDSNLFKVKTSSQANNETVLIKPKLENIISLPYITRDMVINKYYNSEYDMTTFVEKECFVFAESVNVDLSTISSKIIQNLKIDNIQEVLSSENSAEYTLSSDEIQKIVSFIFKSSGFEPINNGNKQLQLFETEKKLEPFDTINLLQILKNYLENTHKKAFSFLEIFTIILHEKNYANFVKLLASIKDESFKKRLARLSKEVLFEDIEAKKWQPEKEFICDKSVLSSLTTKSLYNKDCVKDFNNTEKQFVSFLEKEKNIKYWYRNGSRGDYFCIPYKKNNIVREFFPDFIVYYEDNTIGIYDTKSEMTASDGEAKEKAEYLYAYCNKFNLKNGLIKIEKVANLYYLKINRREIYTNYDANNVEWEELGILKDSENLFLS